jgi:membrane fusion protein, heavy metal efflux system
MMQIRGRAAALSVAAALLVCAAFGWLAKAERDKSSPPESGPDPVLAGGAPQTEEGSEPSLAAATPSDDDGDEDSEPHADADDVPDEGEQAGGDDDDDDGDAIQLDAAQREEFGIEVEAAGPARIRSEIALPGEIEADATRLARVTPRFAGVVTDLRVVEGAWVEKGEVLARLESNESLTAFDLRAPLAGTIVERNATLGEILSGERPAFVIADLRNVWVELSVSERDLARVRVGQSVRIHSPGIGESMGAVSYLSPMLREETRTALARVALPNPDGSWRPGLFVTGSVVTGEVDAAVVVPLEAVQRIDRQAMVFVDSEEGLLPRPVKLGTADSSRVEVISGLVAGERFVAAGGFLLKSELQKAAFQDDDD